MLTAVREVRVRYIPSPPEEARRRRGVVLAVRARSIIVANCRGGFIGD